MCRTGIFGSYNIQEVELFHLEQYMIRVHRETVLEKYMFYSLYVISTSFSKNQRLMDGFPSSKKQTGLRNCLGLA